MSFWSEASLLQRVLYGLSGVGLLLPWGLNLRYFGQGGSVMPSVFWGDAFANLLTTSITVDVYLAALTFSVWVVQEGRVRRPWLYVWMCFGLGLSFALPLYLARRDARAD